jgi:TetR/AcrR family transcriptional regulator, lmrAB and yxaGH operons repressor
MVTTSLRKNSLTLELLKIFRTVGFEAASLSKISEITGLGKASLYHHFPGGKAQMIEEVLLFVEKWNYENIISPLRSKDKPKKKLNTMMQSVSALYDGGKSGCVIGAVVYSDILNESNSKLKDILNQWIDEIEKVLIEEGIDKGEAALRAEDAVVRIQGSLVLAKATTRKSIFTRLVSNLAQELCS